ncbi:MAG: class I SAM-dependent methyltransferase [Roseiflexaceae bacterium]|jgi:ubiquinone/menaquinone biosynthesis C-methylase UbiE|nr:class I SAM-dependent methyltransferase [Chloroflexaceae bacterium]MCE2853191.1 class I SAM-dependent methyltransferase [Chloroflexaceae bacterium]
MRPVQSHFGDVANQYATFRPTYPPQLIADVAAFAGGAQAVALDVACGNGQATLELANYVKHVYASDVADTQVVAMPAHPKISPYVARAEHSALQDHSVDLVTVAQAMHWFDVDAFHREVQRIVRPGGIVAVWSYSLLQSTPAITDIIVEMYSHTRPWWPADRDHVDDGYAKLPFPYTRIPYTPPAMTAQFTLERLIGYLGTWSGVRRYHKDTGRDPVAERVAALRAAWNGDSNHPMPFTFSVAMHVGRV